MTTSFLNAETLRRSLYAQFKCVFWLITIFVVLAAGPAIVLTEQSTGSGGAINVSGPASRQKITQSPETK